MKPKHVQLLLGLSIVAFAGSLVFALNGQTGAREQRLRCQRLERELGPERRRSQTHDLVALERTVEGLRASVRDQRKHQLPRGEIIRRQAKLAEEWSVTSTKLAETDCGTTHRVCVSTVDRNVAEWPALARRMEDLLGQAGTQFISLEVIAGGERDGRRLEKIELTIAFLEQPEEGTNRKPNSL